jgi:tight adherence protein B
VGVLDRLGAELRAGHALSVALDCARPSSGPWAEPLERVSTAVARGSGVEAAAAALSDTTDASMGLVASVLQLGARHGGDLVAAVEAAAAVARGRLALDRELAALSSQAKASALVMVLLPPGFLALAAMTDPRVPAFLAQPPFGWACLIAGVSLDLVGWAWMAALLRRAS